MFGLESAVAGACDWVFTNVFLSCTASSLAVSAGIGPGGDPVLRLSDLAASGSRDSSRGTAIDHVPRLGKDARPTKDMS